MMLASGFARGVTEFGKLAVDPVLQGRLLREDGGDATGQRVYPPRP